jgi:membrane associated rhomboid family serine protease
MRNVTEVVKQLIIINILFFIGTEFLGDVAYKFLSLYYPENPDFQYWQPLTHMFMHGNLMHIFFNMFALFSFGSALEQMWGTKKFLFFYISCGLGAALIHIISNYYFFHDGLNTLVANGIPKEEILKIMSEGKYDSRWMEILSKSNSLASTSAIDAPALSYTT